MGAKEPQPVPPGGGPLKDGTKPPLAPPREPSSEEYRQIAVAALEWRRRMLTGVRASNGRPVIDPSRARIEKERLWALCDVVLEREGKA